MTVDLPFLFAGLIAFAVLAYVVFDGFDLGLGILFPFTGDAAHRDAMVNSVAPVWDGNETWLVAGGGALLAGFPLAYGIIMPALYAPLIAMLLALVFRGVAFEFRFKSRTNRPLWDVGFAAGSIVAAFAQGVALGALLQGIPVADGRYAGGWWDWLSPFSVLTGAALVVGYALLGATWIVLKTTGDLQHEARRWARISGILTLGAIGAVSLWTPFLAHPYWERWFGWPEIVAVAPVPLLVLGAAWLLFSSLDRGRDATPFLAAIGLFVLCFVGLGISIYPWIVPPTISIQDAAAPDESLVFVLVGAVVLVPLILGYTAYAYWVFRGKVDADAGYH